MADVLTLPRRIVQRPLGPFVLNRASPQARALVAWFPMDHMTGKSMVNRANPNAFNLALTDSSLGGVAGAPNVLGIGARVTGAATYTTGGASTNYGLTAANATLVAWVYIPTTSMKGAAVYAGDDGQGYGIGIGSGTWDSNGNNVIGLYGGVRWIDTSVAAGTGEHLLVLVNNASAKPTIYLDGRQIQTDTGTSPFDPDTRFSVCGYDLTSRSFVNGVVADARAYTRALTAGEVWDLYAPATRWDLYWQPSQRVYFDGGAPAVRRWLLARPA